MALLKISRESAEDVCILKTLKDYFDYFEDTGTRDVDGNPMYRISKLSLGIVRDTDTPMDVTMNRKQGTFIKGVGITTIYTVVSVNNIAQGIAENIGPEQVNPKCGGKDHVVSKG